jgi:hypothetical protein
VRDGRPCHWTLWEFEESLLEKAQKQQDIVVMSYDSEGTNKVIYEPKANYEIDRIEAMIEQNNRFRMFNGSIT